MPASSLVHQGNSAGVISTFVDSIDSQIILRMIREPKRVGLIYETVSSALTI